MRKSPINALLLEHDPEEARSMKDALEQDGVSVDVYRTAKDALSQLSAKDYHVSLIDMQLPDVPAVDVLRRITETKPDIVSILLAASDGELAATEAMKLGASDYVVKSSSSNYLHHLPVVVREGLARQRLNSKRPPMPTELWEHARLLEERNVELRRANEELKQLNQAKSDLVSMVSHELRTPLSTIKEFTAILLDEIAGSVNKDQREYLGIVQANVDRLARIINDLLDIAKIEAGRVVLNRGFIDITAAIHHVVQSLQPLADGKQIALSVETPPRLPPLFADPDKVTQVLLNLVGNAIQYTPGHGRVTVRVIDQPNELQMSVQDTGPGILAEDMPKLFEKFQRLRLATATADVPKGTGLGLAICKRLVELHGGQIWAESQPGHGSVFSFTLPKYHAEEVFREYIRNSIEKVKDQRGHLSVVVLAISNFSEIKALYGLEEAGRLLKQVEQLVQDSTRREAGDIITRWQRGETVVLFAEVDQGGAAAIAQRLSRLASLRSFTVGEKSIRLKFTAASATYPEEALTEDELLKVIEARLRPAALAKKRVMVVDDEPKIRQFIQEALEMREYDVLCAASGPDALEQLKAHPVDVILLDLMMPVMDGYEVYHLLKENPLTRGTPVIIVTAKGERKDRMLGMEGTPYNYISKPFQVEDLFSKVQEVLQQQHKDR
jgi:diguanylate cyclase (GGDEF)-like protein